MCVLVLGMSLEIGIDLGIGMFLQSKFVSKFKGDVER